MSRRARRTRSAAARSWIVASVAPLRRGERRGTAATARGWSQSDSGPRRRQSRPCGNVTAQCRSAPHPSPTVLPDQVVTQGHAACLALIYLQRQRIQPHRLCAAAWQPCSRGCTRMVERVRDRAHRNAFASGQARSTPSAAAADMALDQALTCRRNRLSPFGGGIGAAA